MRASLWFRTPLADDVAMASDAIVERVDVVGHICNCQIPVLVDPLLDPLLLQTCKEGFSDCVVPAIPRLLMLGSSRLVRQKRI
jgi:hypothetical protein